MARIILKTAKRETSRSRTVVRSAVTGAFLKVLPSKTKRKSSTRKSVKVAAKRA